MEEEFFEDANEGMPESPQSPIQSFYGGSDAGDDIGDADIENFQLDGNDNAMEGSVHESTEEQPEELENGEHEPENSNTVQTDDDTATSTAAVETPGPASTTAPAERRYKYKYPEAYPTPPGWDDEVWNKAYTAADSRIYNHAKKNHMVSKQKRAEGVTRTEALEWEKTKPAREAKKASKKSRGEATSSKSTTVGASTSHDSELTKKTQKKKVKVNTTDGNSSFQQLSSSLASAPEDLSQFASSSQQTLADRIKGKSAASAAATSAFSNDSSTPTRAESEKIQQSKKASGGNASAKKSTLATKADVHPTLVRAPIAPKVTIPKARTSSKSGTPASAFNVSQDYSDLEVFTDAEGEDDGLNTSFCLCRGLLSTNMIQCDTCEEWFHRRADCLGRDDPAIYKAHEHNIDKWYCPTCREKDPTTQTTFYRMCRREGCDKIARCQEDPTSKYCSDECAVEFFREHLTKAPKDESPSKGGALTQSEIGNLLGSVDSVSEFKSLGKEAPKLTGKGKIVSKQFLRNLVVGNNGKGKEKNGISYENKADYKEKTAGSGKANGEDIKKENTNEEWERQLAATREIYNQEPYYPNGRPTNEEFGVFLRQALGGGEPISTENYLDVDWSFLQRHGMSNPSEAEAIHDLQELIKYDRLWIKNATLKLSFNKAVRQQSAKILKAQDLDPKTHCGYLPIISKSEYDFKIYSETLEGAHICEVGRLEHVNPDLDAEFQGELAASICTQNIKKQRHTTHYNWADTHDKEISGRRAQLTQDMRKQLIGLNDIMSIIHERILEPDWKAIM